MNVSQSSLMFTRAIRLLLILALTACAPLPPSPQDIEAKRFEPVAGKAVIYVVRSDPDFAPDTAGLTLDDQMIGSTYPGTYLRLVVEPGRHRIRGFAGDSGMIVVDVAPGGVFFIRQSVSRWFGFAQSALQPIPEPYGREMVLRTRLAGT
jgi:hypothetical protein